MNEKQGLTRSKTKHLCAVQLEVGPRVDPRRAGEIPSLTHVHRGKTLRHKSELVGLIHRLNVSQRIRNIEDPDREQSPAEAAGLGRQNPIGSD